MLSTILCLSKVGDSTSTTRRQLAMTTDRRYNDISMWGPPGVALVRVVFSRRTYWYSRRRCCLRGCCCLGCRCCPVRVQRARVVIGLSHSPPSPVTHGLSLPSHYLTLTRISFFWCPAPTAESGVLYYSYVCMYRCIRKSRATLADEFAIFHDPSNSINYVILNSLRPIYILYILLYIYI